MKRIFRILLSITFILYLAAVSYLLFFGTRGISWSGMNLFEYIKTSSNFIPFKTINFYLSSILNSSINKSIPLKNLVGNLILFIPMGIYLPYFLKKLNRVWAFIIVLILLLFLIELTQVVTRRGSFDIDDFILNMLGSMLGFGLWKMIFRQKLTFSHS